MKSDYNISNYISPRYSKRQFKKQLAKNPDLKRANLFSPNLHEYIRTKKRLDNA